MIVDSPIVDSPRAFNEAVRKTDFPAGKHATMRAALLISPIGFRLDSESALDNRYMEMAEPVHEERALVQHQNLAQAIMQCGVPVFTLPGQPHLPDGVFPNNVFGTANNSLIIGSMCHQVRRGEADRADVRKLFAELLGYEIRDLSLSSCVAELTGPLVIDRARNIGFCGLSQRADAQGCKAMHEAFELKLTFQFDLKPSEYHTNVIMSVLAGRGVVLHPGSFADPAVPEAIVKFYGQQSIILDDNETAAFVGNCIAVTEHDVFMSARALDGLRPSNLEAIEALGFTLHGVDVDELEKAGGSLRCLVAEVF